MIEEGSCPSCGKKGGYMQHPKLKKFPNLEVHLEEVLVHKTSKTHYKVKEIQTNGIMTVIVSTILPAMLGKRSYISNSTIEEYEKKVN
jgi:hypothetical protein